MKNKKIQLLKLKRFPVLFENTAQILEHAFRAALKIKYNSSIMSFWTTSIKEIINCQLNFQKKILVRKFAVNCRYSANFFVDLFFA